MTEAFSSDPLAVQRTVDNARIPDYEALAKTHKLYINPIAHGGEFFEIKSPITGDVIFRERVARGFTRLEIGRIDLTTPPTILEYFIKVTDIGDGYRRPSADTLN